MAIGWFTVAQLGSNLGPNLDPNLDQVGNAKLGRFGKLGCKSDSGARFASQLDPQLDPQLGPPTSISTSPT